MASRCRPPGRSVQTPAVARAPGTCYGVMSGRAGGSARPRAPEDGDGGPPLAPGSPPCPRIRWMTTRASIVAIRCIPAQRFNALQIPSPAKPT